jgi:hypothetical protein
MVTLRCPAWWLVACCAACLGGCGASGTRDTVVVRIQNDLPVVASLAPCENNTCRTSAGTVRYRLQPGRTMPVNVLGDGTPTFYGIEAGEGRQHCLRVALAVRQRGVVPVSHASTCPRHATAGAGLMESLFAWALLLGITAVGLVTTAVGTKRAYGRSRRAGATDAKAGVVASAVAVALFMGGWLILLLFEAGRRAAARFGFPCWLSELCSSELILRRCGFWGDSTRPTRGDRRPVHSVTQRTRRRAAPDPGRRNDGGQGDCATDRGGVVVSDKRSAPDLGRVAPGGPNS